MDEKVVYEVPSPRGEWALHPRHDIIFEKRAELFGVIDALLLQAVTVDESDALTQIRADIERTVNRLMPPIVGHFNISLDSAGLQERKP